MSTRNSWRLTVVKSKLSPSIGYVVGSIKFLGVSLVLTLKIGDRVIGEIKK